MDARDMDARSMDARDMDARDMESFVYVSLCPTVNVYVWGALRCWSRASSKCK
jgi:hypothetical protein